MIIHPISPVFDNNSRILILGSFPSAKSREEMFFYGHPKNRFWQVLSSVLELPLPKTVEEKTTFLLSNKIALWDVIAACDIVGSSDNSIKNVSVNDINRILNVANIKQIFVNGKTAEKYYNIYMKDKIGREALYLPSTSPANAAWSAEKLVSAWSVIRSIL